MSSEMNLSFLIIWLLGLTAVVNVVIGVVVFRKAPHTLLNRLFLGSSLNVSAWTLTVMVIFIKVDYDSLLFWIRASHAVSAIIPWFVYALVDVFNDEKAYPNKKVIIMFIFSLILAVLSFTPAIIPGIAEPLVNKETLYGPLFPAYAIYFGGAMIYTIYILFRQLRVSRGLSRYQIRYFIGGILVSYLLGNLSNLFLPLLGITAIDLRPFGPVFTLIMLISISYAIVKYRLMDIRLAIRKVLAYIITIVILAGIYVLILLGMEKYFRIYLEANILPFILFQIILIALAFQPVKDKIQSVVDRYLYRGAYHYYDTLIEANKAMLSILHMDKLLNFLVEKVVDTIYIEGAVIFQKDKYGFFTVAAEKLQFISSQVTSRLLEPGNALLDYLEKNAEVLLQTDLKHMAVAAQRTLLVGEMRKLKAEAAVPILMEGKLEAILFLGFKISGEPYSREDVNLLSALSYQVAVSLKNARLYKEVLEIKQYLENVLENMDNGLIAVDAEGKITTFNSTAEKLTGILSGDAMGKKADEVLDANLYPFIMQALRNGQQSSEVEVEVNSKTNTIYLCCSTALVESLETGERGAIMVLSDITRIKELEREKSQVQRLVSLGELAAGMAHEIKNPLVSIKTFAELLPDKYDDYEFRYTFSKIVKGEIERINKLITELLNLSRAHVPCFEEVDTGVIMDEILLLLYPQLGSQKIRLMKTFEKNMPAVRADRDQIKQALLNICLNGIQAMPGGGELRVEIASLHSPQKNSHDSARRMVKIGIQDTGMGISPKQKEKIFDPFFTTKAEGVGIGLSISHRIIADHGGTVQFRSDENGTVFEIALPAVS
ncbi:MAG: ATP-binding protein [Bacillota bacterium]|nr:ATP-binding protein [Bacillota bacterium]